MEYPRRSTIPTLYHPYVPAAHPSATEHSPWHQNQHFSLPHGMERSMGMNPGIGMEYEMHARMREAHEDMRREWRREGARERRNKRGMCQSFSWNPENGAQTFRRNRFVSTNWPPSDLHARSSQTRMRNTEERDLQERSRRPASIYESRTCHWEPAEPVEYRHWVPGSRGWFGVERGERDPCRSRNMERPAAWGPDFLSQRNLPPEKRRPIYDMSRRYSSGRIEEMSDSSETLENSDGSEGDEASNMQDEHNDGREDDMLESETEDNGLNAFHEDPSPDAADQTPSPEKMEESLRRALATEWRELRTGQDRLVEEQNVLRSQQKKFQDYVKAKESELAEAFTAGKARHTDTV
ncbi:hypothetical protein K402DRAFT_100139 [Aulographum hederae CBS 113979]|uniref:Uncharacterized protein n=1 Tax=Aulographum hederae CBS 113979 TaxID=1176131 RepID=A0A6G1GY97_9PEZI|nr:hypothetical protein K402DRAFT_100139 [Aulographum hederae CBS 113979]